MDIDHTTVAAYWGAVLGTLSVIPQVLSWFGSHVEVSARLVTLFYPHVMTGQVHDERHLCIKVVNRHGHAIKVEGVHFREAGRSWLVPGSSGSYATRQWVTPFTVGSHDSVELHIPWTPEVVSQIPFAEGVHVSVSLSTGEVIKSKVIPPSDLGFARS